MSKNRGQGPSDVDHDRLYQVAESQAGYFTAAQAIETGMDRSTLAHIGGPGQGETGAIALADRMIRERSAVLVRHARDLDQRAAHHIERALAIPA